MLTILPLLMLLQAGAPLVQANQAPADPPTAEAEAQYIETIVRGGPDAAIAAERLGRVAPERAAAVMPILRAALRDRDANVRRAATLSLARLDPARDPAMLATLFELLNTGDEPTQAAAREVLGALANTTPAPFARPAASAGAEGMPGLTQVAEQVGATTAEGAPAMPMLPGMMGLPSMGGLPSLGGLFGSGQVDAGQALNQLGGANVQMPAGFEHLNFKDVVPSLMNALSVMGTLVPGGTGSPLGGATTPGVDSAKLAQELLNKIKKP